MRINEGLYWTPASSQWWIDLPAALIKTRAWYMMDHVFRSQLITEHPEVGAYVCVGLTLLK